MPLFDFLCLECGKVSELLVANSADQPECRTCGSRNVKRLLAAPSSLSGTARKSMPGPGDTACCGSSPDQAAGCSGPGSCCGKRPF
ncbi:MAG: zinc ribbon domain-containing protein [Deltaproteobacteria bacterium]|nr:zinc ribbon domain-containing protein [Deltaproteobacteria bacterium]